MEQLGDTLYSKVPSDIVRVWRDNAKSLRKMDCNLYIDGLLFSLRDRTGESVRPVYVKTEDLGEKDDVFIVSITLHGEPAKFIPLQGTIRVEGFIEREEEYDIRYIYEKTTDSMLENGIATTVEEQKKIHFGAITQDCKELGITFHRHRRLDLNEMCDNTIKFIKEME